MSGFLAARGCIYKYTPPGTGGSGFYKVSPAFPQSSGSPILLQGIDLQDNDIISPVVTLEDFKVLYKFGQAFGNATIYGDILLGPVGSTGGGLSALIGWFQANRVSKSSSPITFSMAGGSAYRMYATGLVIGRVDPEYHIQNFAISAIIAEPPK